MKMLKKPQEFYLKKLFQIVLLHLLWLVIYCRFCDFCDFFVAFFVAFFQFFKTHFFSLKLYRNADDPGSIDLSFQIHSSGVNLRYIGLILSSLLSFNNIPRFFSSFLSSFSSLIYTLFQFF